MIERIRCYRFKQILKFEIGIANEHSNYIIEELFILFVSYSFKAKNMIRLIDRFKFLS